MRIFLTRSFSFKCRSDSLCSEDKVLIGDIGCRSRAAISGIDELDSTHCGSQCDGSEVEQGRSIFDLRFLQPQSVALRGSKHLLDAPTQAIEPHDLLRGGKLVRFAGDGQRGEQSPDDWLVTLGGLC